MNKVIFSIVIFTSCFSIHAMNEATDSVTRLFDLVAKHDDESLQQLNELFLGGASPDESKNLLTLAEVAELVDNEKALTILRYHQDMHRNKFIIQSNNVSK